METQERERERDSCLLICKFTDLCTYIPLRFVVDRRDRQTDRQTDRDRDTDRQTDKQTDRQTERE